MPSRWGDVVCVAPGVLVQFAARFGWAPVPSSYSSEALAAAWLAQPPKERFVWLQTAQSALQQGLTEPQSLGSCRSKALG